MKGSLRNYRGSLKTQGFEILAYCFRRLLFVCTLFLACSALNAQNLPDTVLLQTEEQYDLNSVGADYKELVWSTSNQDVAIIDVNGVVIATGPGSASLSAYDPVLQKTLSIFIIVSGSEKVFSAGRPDKFANNIDSEFQDILLQIEDAREVNNTKPRLVVSHNKKYLSCIDDKQPFTFISQTLWSMARRLNREEVIQSLDICKEQGFTAIQLLAHGHYMGENPYGKIPFVESNFLKPLITYGNSPGSDNEYDWWDHLEFIIQAAVDRDLIVCLLPTWREQWNQEHNLNIYNAYAYGKFIGTRFHHLNSFIIWVMGGDAVPDTDWKIELNRELARGIVTAISGKEDYSSALMTYHTYGQTSTVDYFSNDEPFMDFNTIQSGHKSNAIEGMIEKALREQNKPVLDFEPFYDKNGENIDITRTVIYHGIFSGACGTSVGSWNLWHCGARNDLAIFKIPESFHNSFGNQVKHLRTFLDDNAVVGRAYPDSLLINNSTGMSSIKAIRTENFDKIFIYTTRGEAIQLKYNILPELPYKYFWFNPRTGEVLKNENYIISDYDHLIYPPSNGKLFSGHDWIMVGHKEYY